MIEFAAGYVPLFLYNNQVSTTVHRCKLKNLGFMDEYNDLYLSLDSYEPLKDQTFAVAT